jgi:hypothetical protein
MRWDDPLKIYRILYTADTEIGAYVEVLKDVRTRMTALKIFNDVDGEDFGNALFTSVNNMMVDTLSQRHLGTLIPSEIELHVNVVAPLSRTELESPKYLNLKEGTLQTGFASVEGTVRTRKISRWIFIASDAYVGIKSPSAEHDGTHCYSFYETDHKTNELRGSLCEHTSRPALDDGHELELARKAVKHLTGVELEPI